jgi:hypothetical protein
VIAVDDELKVATLLRPDGSTFEAYPVDGTLPAVGEFVAFFQNGGDPVVLSTTRLAEGTRQSWDYTPGETGWAFTADGDLEANAGVFRADVTGARIRTAITGPRVEIVGDLLSRLVSFFTGDDDELAPGQVASYDDALQGAVEIRSPEFTEGGEAHYAVLRVSIDRTDGTTFVDAVADNVRVGGTSISRPPYSSKTRSPAQTVGSSAATAQAILWNNDLLVNFESAIAYDGTSGYFLIKRPGIYHVTLIITFFDADLGYADGSRRLRVEEVNPGGALPGGQRVMQTVIGVGGDGTFPGSGLPTVMNASTDLIVPTTATDALPFRARFFAGQVNGFDLPLDITGRIRIKRESDR